MRGDYVTEIQELINANRLCLLYFYNNHCAPCRALRPKLEYMMHNKYPQVPIEQVDSSIFIRVAAHFDVYAAPVMIVFAEGKEWKRFSKFISIDELDHEIHRLQILMN